MANFRFYKNIRTSKHRHFVEKKHRLFFLFKIIWIPFVLIHGKIVDSISTMNSSLWVHHRTSMPAKSLKAECFTFLYRIKR